MFADLRRTWRLFSSGQPGHRFGDSHDRKQRSGKGTLLKRLARLGLALACVAVGAILLFIPGPAIPFFIVAGSLLAAESRGLATMLDRGEVKLRAAWIAGQRHWRKLPAVGKAVIGGLALSGAFGATYLSYQWFLAL